MKVPLQLANTTVPAYFAASSAAIDALGSTHATATPSADFLDADGNLEGVIPDGFLFVDTNSLDVKQVFGREIVTIGSVTQPGLGLEPSDSAEFVGGQGFDWEAELRGFLDVTGDWWLAADGPSVSIGRWAGGARLLHRLSVPANRVTGAWFDTVFIPPTEGLWAVVLASATRWQSLIVDAAAFAVLPPPTLTNDANLFLAPTDLMVPDFWLVGRGSDGSVQLQPQNLPSATETIEFWLLAGAPPARAAVGGDFWTGEP